METIEPTVTIDITEDMIGDLFETREGKIVFMVNWCNGGFPAHFSDGSSRRKDGVILSSDIITPRDLVRHLPESKYPEYYL